MLCFAHVAYQLEARWAARATGIAAFQVRSLDELQARIGEADVLVVSGLWRDTLLAQAPRLRFIQAIGAGTDQFSRPALQAAGIRLASAAGVNARAVSEHAMALILALVRRLPEARDNQTRRHWRGMIGDLAGREDELGGKTLAIVGPGRIGGRLARLARAFDMTTIGVRRDPASGLGDCDEVVALGALKQVLPRVDFVALTCPLTAETEGLMDAAAFAAMRPGAYLINVARGRCVDEAALVAALEGGRIAGAGIDVTVDEPLGAESPLWGMKNVLLTPHTAGETRAYEDNLFDILQDNLGRLAAGQAALRNQII